MSTAQSDARPTPVPPKPVDDFVIILHLSSAERFEAITRNLCASALAAPIHATLPAGELQAVEAVAQANGLVVHCHTHDAPHSAAQAFMQLLPSLRESAANVFLRLCDIPSDIPLSPAIQSHVLNDLAGDDALVRTVATSLATTPQLRLVGSAADRFSMRVFTPAGLSKLDLLVRRMQLPEWDWGFHASGCFWGRIDDFIDFTHLDEAGQLSTPELPAAGLNTWGNAFERLFATVGMSPGASIGLIDHRIDQPVPELRIVPSTHPPANRPIEVIESILQHHDNKRLAPWLLLQDAGLLDPWWYYLQHPELSGHWGDALQHHLDESTPALNQAHADGLLSYEIRSDGLAILDRDRALVRLQPRRHAYLSDANANPVRMQPGKGARDGIKVSVICPTYNQQHLLAQCLDSLLAQQVDFDYEIIVGNDASTDDSRTLIDAYAVDHPGRLVIVHRDRNLGAAGNVFDLLSRARGDYISLCEGDDYWTNPHKLQLQAAHLDANPHCALHFHTVEVLDEASRGRRSLFPTSLAGQAFTHDHIVRTNFLPTNGVMYRRTARLESLLTDGGAQMAMLDWLGHILASLEGELHMSPVPMGVYRKHSGGMWSQHTGTSFIPRWGRFYTSFQRQVRLATGSLHHTMYCQRELDWFAKMFRFLFTNHDNQALWQLIADHRDCAQFYFARNGVDIDLHRIDNADSLAMALRNAFRISTIILCNGDAARLRRALDSVDAQEGAFAHDILILADASNADVSATISAFIGQSRNNVRTLTPAAGSDLRASITEALLSCSTSTMIAFCRGDDYWISPGKLARQVMHLLENADHPMCFTWQLWMHEFGAHEPDPSQAALPHLHVEPEQLVTSNLAGSLSAALYRRTTLESALSTKHECKLAPDRLLPFHAATLGPLGFVRDLLTACHVRPGAATAVSSTGNPDHIRQAAPTLINSPAAQWPAHIARRANPELRLHLDRIETTIGYFLLSGWLAHAGQGTHADEEKVLFVTDHEGHVCHAQPIANVQRADVERFYHQKQGITEHRFDWAGFLAVLKDIPPDGSYRLVIGLRQPDGTFATAYHPRTLQVMGGIPTL